MASDSPDYKALYEAEQRRRQEAERAKQDEQHRREEAERAKQDAERAKQDAESQTRRTTLPQYLHACHVHLQAGLTVQSADLSTKGDPSNARSKKRADHMRKWTDFPSRQVKIWNELVSSPFMTEGHFTSRHTMLEDGESIRRRMISSELDIHHFERRTVEEKVSLVIERIFANEGLREKFGLKGSVQFENHANTLSPEDGLSEGVRSMDISRGRRRSPRLMELEQKKRGPRRASSPGSGPVGLVSTNRPRADQFCVYNTSGSPGMGERVPAFIVEYKAPHKLTLPAIREGLRDTDLEELLECGEDESPRRKYQRLVAASVTQAFSYMISAGLEYGYVCTGQAFIFLRVPEDPTTVQYFLSVPQADVGNSTGWFDDDDDDDASSAANRLHLTAVGQVLAFTLQALRSPPRSHEWRRRAESRLSTWEYSYADILDDAPAIEATPSEFWPSPDNELLRVSPIVLRTGRVPQGRMTCQPPSHAQAKESGPDGDQDGNPDTPSQPPRKPASAASGKAGSRKAPTRPRSDKEGRGKQETRAFCTSRCLVGLVNGGSLDLGCPNVAEHKVDGSKRDFHGVDKAKFLQLMRKQLSRTLDSDFEPCGRPGSRGVPFKATLASHGYTLIAKCTPLDFVKFLRHERDVYERLCEVQGRCVPVHLGNIDLAKPYYYEGIAKLVHVMFLSYGGTPIFRHREALVREEASKQVAECFNAIHALGVLHRDAMPRNILWNGESRQVTVIDFERAEMGAERQVLGPLSTNRKRKQSGGRHGLKSIGCPRALFEREIARVKAEISCL